MSDAREDKVVKQAETEMKTLKKRTEKMCKELDKKSGEKKDLEKQAKGGSKDAKKKLVDLDKFTKQVVAHMMKEMNSTNARINRMLQQEIPEKKPDSGMLKGLEKRLGGVVTKHGIKVGNEVWVKPDIDLKKKNFGLTVTGKFK